VRSGSCTDQQLAVQRSRWNVQPGRHSARGHDSGRAVSPSWAGPESLHVRVRRSRGVSLFWTGGNLRRCTIPNLVWRMNPPRWVRAALGLVAAGACGILAGCSDDTSSGDEGGAGLGGEGGLGGGEGGDGGGGGTIDPGCIPSMLPTGESISGECGVFVAAGATGAGTKDDPTSDLPAALASVPANQAVYICGTATFTGTFAAQGGRSIFGGVACGAWTYDAASRPTLMGVADSPTLTVSGSGATKLEDFDVESVDAVAAGASSIGVLVDGTSTDLARVDVTAKAGATGAAGTAQAKEMTPATANGGPGTNGCLGMTSSAGGPAGQQTCGVTLVDGGSGGQGSNSGSGGPGGDGEPTLQQGGKGGKAETTSLPVACDNGTEGDPGIAGNAGPGAQAADLGVLSGAGFTGALGGAGLTSGGPGQGGGGGGGANACTGAGPGGGGGGAGGCGGNPGNGGGGGGGSFALVSINATVNLTAVSLVSGAGGTGGAGDAGQEGMDGGIEGPAGTGGGACNGGPGGKGGRGGAGGGGRGGPSVAIAYVGDAPIENDGVELTIATTAASGGIGGNGGAGNMGGVGAEGLLALRQAWP
jgi:hypothetical protein